MSGEATEINCPPNTTRVADQCYQNKPVDWPGGETIGHLQHKTEYSTVGSDTSKSIPMSCDPGQELHAALCYKNPDPNIYQYSSPGWYRGKCPATHPRWDGSGCWNDTYTNGVGTIPDYTPCPSNYTTYPLTCTNWNSGYYNYSWGAIGCRAGASDCHWHGCNDCYQTWISTPHTINRSPVCPPGQTNIAGLCYNNCKQGYHFVGGNLCAPDDGNVVYPGLKSVIGTLPSQCNSPDRELIGRLCYPKCPNGYERTAGNIEMCQTKCPDGFKNIGIGGCEKPVGYRYNVGVCPTTHPYRLEALCYVNESVAI